MQWQDEGFVLAARPHGEHGLIVQLLTRGQGRHAGLVRGGQGSRVRGLYQPGNLLAANWSARLADHLGAYTCELVTAHAARLLDDPARLLALAAAAALSERALPEREPHPACFEGFKALLAALDGDHWAEVYVRWELALLAELGFGLELDRCAANPDWRPDGDDPLSWVSPRTGRAVSLSAGAAYRDRLLALPAFLRSEGDGGPEEVAQGLALSGHFLERHIFHPQDRALPEPRQRLALRFG